MDKYNTVKLILSGMIAGVSSKLGILGPMLLALTCVMAWPTRPGVASDTRVSCIKSCRTTSARMTGCLTRRRVCMPRCCMEARRERVWWIIISGS